MATRRAHGDEFGLIEQAPHQADVGECAQRSLAVTLVCRTRGRIARTPGFQASPRRGGRPATASNLSPWRQDTLTRRRGATEGSGLPRCRYLV